MNRWLAEESKWAREQAVAARRQAEQLEDPEWIARRISVIRRSEDDLRRAVDRHLQLVTERHQLEDDAERADLIARLKKDAALWEVMAAEQSARLEQTEQDQEALIP